MIYLRYAFQKSGLPAPRDIGLQIQETGPVQNDVLKEFSIAFPDAHVEKELFNEKTFDFLILAYREKLGVMEGVMWAQQHFHRAKLGIG